MPPRLLTLCVLLPWVPKAFTRTRLESFPRCRRSHRLTFRSREPDRHRVPPWKESLELSFRFLTSYPSWPPTSAPLTCSSSTASMEAKWPSARQKYSVRCPSSAQRARCCSSSMQAAGQSKFSSMGCHEQDSQWASADRVQPWLPGSPAFTRPRQNAAWILSPTLSRHSLALPQAT